MNYKALGLALLAGSFIIVGFVLYFNSDRRQEALYFSDKPMLQGLWNNYKAEYLEPDTFRTLDKQRGNITTSEGQSYAMLRAVWLDDKDTFDKSWQWTKDNLQREEDALFSWLFGQRSDGGYGVLTETGGQNSATDADVDIALALAFAFSRWQEPQYLEEARAIITSVWDESVVTVADKPYLAANNLEQDAAETIVLNPSYFAPYAYRIFAEIDTSHPWLHVVDTSYEVLARSSTEPLDASMAIGLPPDWVLIDRNTGALRAPTTYDALSTNYSYDALRIPWRLALDWQWFDEPRAHETLKRMEVLAEEWRHKQALYPSRTHSGALLTDIENPAMYGGSIGYFMVAEPTLATEVFDKKLRTLYNPDTFSWKTPLGYYDDNWAWFGIALYHDELVNLWEFRNS